MEKCIHDPYDLDNARPDLTTMPSDACTKVCTPNQVIERWLGGDKARAGTPDNRIMLRRNQSLLVFDADEGMAGFNVIFCKYSLHHQLLVVKTPQSECDVEKFITTYCERHDTVVAVLESPLIKNLPGASLWELARVHYRALLLKHWDGSGGEDALIIAKVLMFVLDHLKKTPAAYGWVQGRGDSSKAMLIAHFNTEDVDELMEDIRTHKAMVEIAK